MNIIKKPLLQMRISWLWVRQLTLVPQLSNIDVITVALHPGQKMAYFHKYWGTDLEKDVLTLLKKKVHHILSDL